MAPDFMMGYHLISMLPEQEEEKQDADAEHKEGDKKKKNIEYQNIILVVYLSLSSVDSHDEPDFDAKEPEKTKNCFNIFYLFHFNQNILYFMLMLNFMYFVIDYLPELNRL